MFLKMLQYSQKNTCFKISFIQKRLQDRSFPVDIEKFVRTAFSKIPLVTASELKFDISKIILRKSQKKQTKQILLNRYDFFSYIVNINKNLKKIDEKKGYFKHI